MAQIGAHEGPLDPALARSHAVDVVRTLQKAGHRALLAGGCVRDELLGLHPTDYDVATDAKPEQIGELFRSTAHVGAHFGVVIVRTGKGEGVEVATFRRDGDYSDNRRPDSVEFASEEEDAQRRDFTINALFLDPLAAEDAPAIHGHVVDYVGGLADLSARIIRAVGHAEDRLREDHLRALRAVRFAARLGYEIEHDTARAIREHAGQLRGVSVERIGHELRRMLSHPNRARAAQLIVELGMEAPIFGEHIEHALVRLSRLKPESPFEWALAAWILDRQGAGAKIAPYRRALCLSNDESAAIASIIEIVGIMSGAWEALGVAGQKRLASREGFEGALAVFDAEDSSSAMMVRGRVAELADTPGGLAPEPLIGGDELIEMGFQPGPFFASVLRDVYDAQLDGRISDLEGAKSLAQKLLGSGNSGRPGASHS
ncbi:MAG: hypothetical protein KDA31_04200 [Phycisphaerales bacterium]|nr:hypothetical protein [Phycisphaerales bacterium]MCB9836082.1 CCA tRNA nucleotidyltransferase [Phycisphaera sp.]